jgi:hypothetical protein
MHLCHPAAVPFCSEVLNVKVSKLTQMLPTRQVAVDVEARGFAVLRALVPPEAVDAALRHIHLDVVRRGLPAETMGPWLWSAHWFPHLKWDPEIVALAWHLPEELRDGELCDPQILLQPPDEGEDQALVSHIDQEPDWSAGRGYRAIVGVALSPAHAGNGGLVVWPFDRPDEPEPLNLEAGDVVVMHPKLPHSSGLNREGGIRYAVYFRFLDRA